MRNPRFFLIFLPKEFKGPKPSLKEIYNGKYDIFFLSIWKSLECNIHVDFQLLIVFDGGDVSKQNFYIFIIVVNCLDRKKLMNVDFLKAQY